MSETPIVFSNINDFIFCPASIYFHSLDISTEKMMYHTHSQINGTATHAASDNKQYSDRSSVLQAIDVYCEKYNIIGKIDVFDSSTGALTERKRTIKTIYDGYIFQLYAQYFSLVEMGYDVKEINLYSMSDNKKYRVKLPNDDAKMLCKFEQTLYEMRRFDFSSFVQNNSSKCDNCIYEELCSFSTKER